MITKDNILETDILRIIKSSNTDDISLKNKSYQDINVDTKRFYITNDNIYLSSSTDVLILHPNETKEVRLEFINYVYDGNEPLFIYDVGISVLRVPEFPFDLRYTYFNHFNNSLFGEEI